MQVLHRLLTTLCVYPQTFAVYVGSKYHPIMTCTLICLRYHRHCSLNVLLDVANMEHVFSKGIRTATWRAARPWCM